MDASKSTTNEAAVFFPGAPGNYDYTLVMTDSAYGVIDTTSNPITISAKGSFAWKAGQPTQGSVNGGTLLTLTGSYITYSATSTFETNSIQFGVGGEQGVFADVKSITQTDASTGAFEMTVLTRPAAWNAVDGQRDDQTLYVFGMQKIINPMNCTGTNSNSGISCTWQYKAADSVLLKVPSNLTLTMDTSTNSQSGAFYKVCADVSSHNAVTLSGYSTSNVNFYWGGEKQEIISVSTSTVCGKFTTSSAIGSTPQAAWFQFGSKGWNSWAKTASDTKGTEPQLSLKTPPQVLQVYPAVGGTAGNIIKISVAGFGPEIGGLTVKTTGNTVVCSRIISTSYGWITCQTVTGTIAANNLEVIDSNGNTYKCLSSCSYSQTDAATPKVTAIAKSGSNFQLTSTGMLATSTAADYTIKFNNVTCTFVSATATLVICTPGTSEIGEMTNVLSFRTQAGSFSGVYYETYAAFSSNYGVLTNPSFTFADPTGQTNIGSSGVLTTSFQGGLSFVLRLGSSNLQGNRANNGLTVTVCGTPATCTDYTGGTAVQCSVPPLKSQYYYDSIVESATLNNLMQKRYTPNQDNFIGTPVGNSLYGMDGDTLSTYYGTLTDGRCFVGWTAPSGFVVRASAVGINFKMTNATKANYVGSQLQALTIGANASLDASWVNLTALNFTIHNGYNYYYLNSTHNTYGGFRWLNTISAGCTVQELRVNGVLMQESTTATQDCPVAVTVGL